MAKTASTQEKLKVKIKTCTMSTKKYRSWYEDKIGEKFNVREGTMHYYYDKGGKVFPIRKSDAKVVN